MVCGVYGVWGIWCVVPHTALIRDNIVLRCAHSTDLHQQASAQQKGNKCGNDTTCVKPMELVCRNTHTHQTLTHA